MVKCRDCKKEMLDVNTTTCTKKYLKRGGVRRFERIPYYNEYRKEPHQCHDCGIQLGGIHHLGCDMEICPRCKEMGEEHSQLISCGCFEDNFRAYN